MGKRSMFCHYDVRIATATAVALIVVTMLFGCGKAGFAQASPEPGVISGTVSADRGVVRGFRVKARDTVHRVAYTVYTQAGRYQFSQLPASHYQVQVWEEGFESAPATVEVKPGEKKTVDLALTAQAPEPSKVEYVDYDTLYPPEPGRAVLEMTCMGCHGKDMFHTRRLALPIWKSMIGYMTTSGSPRTFDGLAARADLPEEQKEIIAQYLAKHFGPDSRPRDLKLDELVVDEEAVAGALFIEYELPEAPPNAPRNPRNSDESVQRGLHDPAVAPDGVVWFSDTGANSVVGLDPRALDFQKRFQTHFIESASWDRVHGVAVNQKGRVYWNELNTGYLGEFDPKTGESQRIKSPHRGGGHSLAVDSKGNVWNNVHFGSVLSKLDTSTGKISYWETPTPYPGMYGIIVAPDDKVWTVALGKHMIIKFDPVTEKFTEYRTPSQPSGPRRLVMDSKGKIWFSEYMANSVGVLDPETGKMEEYRLPLRNTHPYAIWTDGEDNIWLSDLSRSTPNYNSLIKFDPRTKKFAYFPLPSPKLHVPHMVLDQEGTLWFGQTQAVAFRPNGNSPGSKD